MEETSGLKNSRSQIVDSSSCFFKDCLKCHVRVFEGVKSSEEVNPELTLA
jgi:ferredoxin